MTPARRWALATTAIYVRYNLEDPGLLGGMPPGDASAADARDQLDGWPVTNASEARAVLARLARGRYPKTKAQAKRARAMLAYDQARICHVAGLAYVAGFLDEAAAWEACLAAARRIQTLYASWDEFGAGYLLGMKSVEGTVEPGVRWVYRALVLEKSGPWSIAWDTRLD